ncbi:MAG: hypothetical protein DSY47_08385 [Hydrogenothermus sp.]|nr:MAG: hypothetical protein DSY47_08385 [Hydrogenothermus sp.]
MLYTIGYSPFFEVEKLTNKLKELDISTVFDIRTFPYSNTFPQYNEPNFKPYLKKQSIEYKFLGDYVGGLIVKKEVQKGINSLYDLTRNPKIKKGLNFLYKVSKNKNAVIMCAEKSPFDCHRFLAIGALLHFYTDLKVYNIIENSVFEFGQTVKKWKNEQNLENFNINDEKLIFQRLNYIYKQLNKREEKVVPQAKNLSLF